MATIVTHTSPDWDAIASCWLLDRFSPLKDCGVVFVNTGNPDADLLATADAVADTGKVYNSPRRRYDHHQLPGAEANATCAAWMVYSDLTDTFRAPLSLSPLVELVYAGDTGKPAAQDSRKSGIHALLSEWKAQRIADQELLRRGYDLLDMIAKRLTDGLYLPDALAEALLPHTAEIASYQQRQIAATVALDACTVYRSVDGLLLALDNAPQGATFAAFEAGAQIVVWHSDYPDKPTVAAGISRAFECQVHLGDLVAEVERQCWPDLGVELARWYRHPAGFMAGRGTQKAPMTTPFDLDLALVAALFDSRWMR